MNKTQRPSITRTEAFAFVGLVGCAIVVLDSPLDLVGRLIALGLLTLVGLSVSLAHRAAARDGVQLLAALLGAPVCAAYGAVHVVEGSPVAALIGVAGAAAWLIVLVVSSLQLIRRASWLVRGGAVAMAVVAAQLVLLPVAAGTGGAHPPRARLDGVKPLGASEVSLAVGPAVVLNGWYTRSSNGAAVVLLPGAGGNRAQTIDHAAVLTRHGFGVLAIDARGSGDSTGYGSIWGWTGNEDVSAALDWLGRQPDVDPLRLGVVGLSMGAEQALTAAAVDSRISAVVAEGVEGRIPADTWYTDTDLRGTVEGAVNFVMWAVGDLWSPADAPPPLRGVVSALGGTNVLIIAADVSNERLVAADLARRSNSIELWQTIGIAHIEGLASAPAEWESRVVGFLMRSL